MMAYACNPAIPQAKAGRLLEARSLGTAWATWLNPVSTKNIKVSSVWWCTPVVPATQKAEAGGWLEPRMSSLHSAMMEPLHSSLDGVLLCHSGWSAVVQSLLTATSASLVQSLTVSLRLECSGAIIAHCSLDSLGSNTLILEVWDGARDSAFPTGPQVMLLLRVWKRYSEKYFVQLKCTSQCVARVGARLHLAAYSEVGSIVEEDSRDWKLEHHVPGLLLRPPLGSPLSYFSYLALCSSFCEMGQ
ncbi:hypothetical protein AAY473_008796 [Plecturocebus cupreus]